jgi:phage-related protein
MARGYKIADGYIEITVETDKGDRQIKRFLRDTRGRLHDEQGRYASEGELAGIAWADKLTKGADKESEKGFRGMFSRWGRKFAGFGRTLGGLFANKFVGLAVAGLGALPSAISAVTSALGAAINIGGAGAALAPAGIAALLLSVGALKTAFGGLGAAMKAGLSGDMQAFAAATKDMAPAMQQAVKALVQLNPLLKDLKRGVQQNFWGRFVDDIKPLGTIYLPMIGKTLATIGAGFGVAADQIAKFLMNTGVASGMADAFDSIGQAVRNVTSGLLPVVQAFLTLFRVGASFLPGLTAGFAGLAQHFADFIAIAAQTGKLQSFIQGGIDKVKALGAGLSDIIGIFKSIGQAASGVAGGGLFSALGQLLGMVNAFFQTLQGQEVLTNFFSRLQAIGKLIIGLVSGALPGLLAFSSGLLSALQSLAPIAPVVGKAIGDALTALAPLLPVIGKVLAILLTLASGILSTIAAELGPMIALWGQLATALADKLLPVISDMISQGLPIAVQLGKNLADAFAPLIPVILQVADAFMGGLVQVLPQLLSVAQKLLPLVTELAQQFAGAMLDALNRLQPYIPDMVKAFVLLVEVFATLMGEYLPNAIRLFTLLVEVSATVFGWIFDLGEAIGSLVGWFGSIGSKVSGFVSGAGSALVGWVSSAVSWFASLPGKIWNGLVSLVTMIPQIFDQAIKSAGFAIGFGIGVIINMVTGLPHRAAEALSSLGSMIAGVAEAAWAWVTLKFYQGVAAAVNFARNLPGMAKNAISALGSLIASTASDAWNRLKSAFSTGISNAISLAKSLPGKIKDALSGAASWLFGAGQDVVRGLWNGIKDMIGWIVRKGIDFGSSVISGIKKGLGIGSPSKRARDEVGRWIPPGIMDGVDREMPKLYKYMDAKMSGLVTRPPAVNVAAPNVNVPPTTVYVLLDSKQIGAQIVIDPKKVAAATAEGNRQRNFVNTGRPAGAFG